MRVRVTVKGDSEFKVGQLVELDSFVTAVKAILANGGEMPTAVLWLI